MTHETPSALDEDFIVHNRLEIIQILKDLEKQKVMLNASFNHGQDYFSTSVVSVDADKNAVFLDIGRDQAFNSRLFASHKVTFSKDSGVRIRWTSTHLTEVVFDDEEKAIKIALPHDLTRIQRREFFRLATPTINPVPCRIPIPDETSPDQERYIELSLVDVSLGGIGANAPDPLDPLLVEGASFDNCKVSFPDVGVTSLTLLVRKISPVSMKDGSIRHRIGMEFINPSRGNQGLIQRYTFNLERNAMTPA
jgi:flagellar brake protein